MPTTETCSPLQPGTRVLTIKPAREAKDWSDEALMSRQWGVIGKILRHHDSHGLTYEVQHGGTTGHYEPRELIVLSNVNYPLDSIQGLTAEEARAKRPGFGVK